jgi:hypothetical protein
MELYCAVGGQTDSLKRWEADLNAQFFPIYKDGKPLVINGEHQFRRLLVAPIQLYKIAFAKEELQNVLACVHPSDYIQKRYSILNKALKFIKKVLGLKPVPKPLKINPFLQPNQNDKAVFVLPIGLKDDAVVNASEMI